MKYCFLQPISLNPFSANPTKGSNTLKQFRLFPTNCFSVWPFCEFVAYSLKAATKHFHHGQKQPFADAFQNRCPWKFRNIYRKMPVLKSVFNKLQTWSPATSLKRDFDTGVFLWMLRIFKNSSFTEHLWWRILHGPHLLGAETYPKMFSHHL